MHNPVTGDLGRLTVSPNESGGQLLEGELWLQPGAAVLGEHTHSAIEETFNGLEGSSPMCSTGLRTSPGRGDAAHIPVGVAHDWWNGGDRPAHIHVPGLPAR